MTSDLMRVLSREVKRTGVATWGALQGPNKRRKDQIDLQGQMKCRSARNKNLFGVWVALRDPILG